jgi:hypothetical protein
VGNLYVVPARPRLSPWRSRSNGLLLGWRRAAPGLISPPTHRRWLRRLVEREQQFARRCGEWRTNGSQAGGFRLAARRDLVAALQGSATRCFTVKVDAQRIQEVCERMQPIMAALELRCYVGG